MKKENNIIEESEYPPLNNPAGICKHISNGSYSLQNDKMMAFCLTCGATYDCDNS